MRYTFLIFTLFYSIIANSQNSLVGIYASPEITLPIDRRMDLKTRLGYSFGLSITKKISKKRLWINTGIGITNRGYQFTEIYGSRIATWRYSATDIDIPLLFQYRVLDKKKLFGFVSLGTIFGFKIKEGADSSSTSYRFNDKNFSYPERINLRIGLGFGYKLKQNFQIQAEPFIMKDVMALNRENWKYGYFSNTYSWGARLTFNYLITSKPYK